MADDTDVQFARLERYAAWARTELERLVGAGEDPNRPAVLREKLEGASVVLERSLARRRVPKFGRSACW